MIKRSPHAPASKTRRRFIGRLLDAEKAADTWEAVGILLYTPEEVARMESQGHCFRAREIQGKGRVLYERA